MAGDWIKMRTNLWDDPRVARICDTTNSGEAAIIGALYWLWATADEHTETGVLPGLSIRQINRKVGIKGFAEALVDINWILETNDGILIVSFEEHNGTSAKKRIQTAKRVANHAAANASNTKTEENDNAELTQKDKTTNASSVSSALPKEDLDLDLDKTNTPNSPQGGKRSPVGINSFLTDCKTANQKPIPENDPVFEYADSVSLPQEFLRICWREFVERNRESGKRYKDWRSAFRKSVRGNWFRLWWLDPNDEQYKLTTVGLQAQRKHSEAAA